jgi:glycosyltransferase involved in cell wall biosynthesis
VKAVQRLHLQVREQERQPDFDVVVAGGVDARVFRGASLPELPFLRCVGYVSDGELRALYEHAALFVYPSLYEGFGIPAIEAMACGCPVIASNAGSLPEVCGPAARYVSPHDEAELTRVISELMADPAERERMSEEGRRWAARYSWDESARLNAEYVRECVRLLNAGSEPVASIHAR